MGISVSIKLKVYLHVALKFWLTLRTESLTVALSIKKLADCACKELNEGEATRETSEKAKARTWARVVAGRFPASSARAVHRENVPSVRIDVCDVIHCAAGLSPWWHS